VTNALGLPDDAILARPSPLRELLATKPVHVTPVRLEDPLWGPLQGKTLGVRSLSAGQPVECVGRAIEWCLKTAKIDRADLYTDNGGAALDLITRVEILHLALVDTAPPYARLTDNPGEILELFTAEQVVWLHDRYGEVQQARSPIKHLADPEKIKEVAAALGKGFLSPTSLKSFDAGTLRSISHELVELLLKQTMPPSSGTGSPNF